MSDSDAETRIIGFQEDQITQLRAECDALRADLDRYKRALLDSEYALSQARAALAAPVAPPSIDEAPPASIEADPAWIDTIQGMSDRQRARYLRKHSGAPVAPTPEPRDG